MDKIVDIFIRWAVPFACAFVFTIVSDWFKRKCGHSKAIENGVKSLLRTEIIRQYEKYSEKGYCPIYAREPLTKVYEAYHALHGNGTGTDLYEKTIELPTEPKEKIII